MAPIEQSEDPGKDRPTAKAPSRSEPDNIPGNRLPQDSGSPIAPGGSEQPKNDRRKRGHLEKRRTHLPSDQ